jgi:hypothetical protein
VGPPSQRLVDRLKRERFRAIFDYLRRGDPAPLLNLLETVQVAGMAGLLAGGGGGGRGGGAAWPF